MAEVITNKFVTIGSTRGFYPRALRYWQDAPEDGVLTLCFGKHDCESYTGDCRLQVLAWLASHSVPLPPAPPVSLVVVPSMDRTGRSLNVRLSLADLELLASLRRRTHTTNRDILSAGLVLVEQATRRHNYATELDQSPV